MNTNEKTTTSVDMNSPYKFSSCKQSKTLTVLLYHRYILAFFDQKIGVFTNFKIVLGLRLRRFSIALGLRI